MTGYCEGCGNTICVCTDARLSADQSYTGECNHTPITCLCGMDRAVRPVEVERDRYKAALERIEGIRNNDLRTEEGAALASLISRIAREALCS